MSKSRESHHLPQWSGTLHPAMENAPLFIPCAQSSTIMEGASSAPRPSIQNPKTTSGLCSLCGEEFADDNKLEIHKRAWHFKQCSKVYNGELDVNEQDFDCTRCNERFSSSTLLRYHLANNVRHNWCAHCDKDFVKKSGLAGHMALKHGDSSLAQSLGLKLESVEKGALYTRRCPDCMQGFDTDRNFFHHPCMVREAPFCMVSCDKSGNEAFTCIACDKVFPNTEELLTHKGLKGTVSCLICSAAFCNVAGLLIHFQNSDKHYWCKDCQCEYSFSEKDSHRCTKGNIDTKFKRHPGGEVLSLVSRVGKKIEASVAEEPQLHLTSMIPPNTVVETSSGKASRRARSDFTNRGIQALPTKFHCDKCDTDFPSEDALYTHKLTSSAHIRCMACTQEFTDLASLKNHYAKGPAGKDCPNAPKTNRTMWRIERYLTSEGYKCDWCFNPHVSATRSNFIAHLYQLHPRFHKILMKGLCYCVGCGKKFSDVSSMLLHINRNVCRKCPLLSAIGIDNTGAQSKMFVDDSSVNSEQETRPIEDKILADCQGVWRTPFITETSTRHPKVNEQPKDETPHRTFTTEEKDIHKSAPTEVSKLNYSRKGFEVTARSRAGSKTNDNRETRERTGRSLTRMEEERVSQSYHGHSRSSRHEPCLQRVHAYPREARRTNTSLFRKDFRTKTSSMSKSFSFENSDARPSLTNRMMSEGYGINRTLRRPHLSDVPYSQSAPRSPNPHQPGNHWLSTAGPTPEGHYDSGSYQVGKRERVGSLHNYSPSPPRKRQKPHQHSQTFSRLHEDCTVPRHGTGKQTRKVYVGNLGPRVTVRDLYECFAKYYPVAGSVRIYKKGFAFIEFYNEEDAKMAIAHLDSISLFGRRIIVQFASYDSKSPLDLKTRTRSGSPQKAAESRKNAGRSMAFDGNRFTSSSADILSETFGKKLPLNSRNIVKTNTDRKYKPEGHGIAEVIHFEKTDPAFPIKAEEQVPGNFSDESGTVIKEKTSKYPNSGGSQHAHMGSDGNNWKSIPGAAEYMRDLYGI